jgi:hypothetical protein
MILIPIHIWIFLGSILVAMIANTSNVLDYLNWNRVRIGEATWMQIVLEALVSISGHTNLLRRKIAYALVILWALIGIAARFPAEGVVTMVVWVAFGLVALKAIAAFFWHTPVWKAA